MFATEGKPFYMMCKLGGTVRTVRIDKDANGCKVIYTKEGKDKQVGEAKGFESCRKIAENIHSNLTTAHWTCRDVSEQSELTTPESEKK